MRGLIRNFVVFFILVLTLSFAAYAAVMVNGYPLDTCSHVDCGERTASIHCYRIGEGKLINFTEATGATGTWRYSSTGGYYYSNGVNYFSSMECGFTGQEGSVLYAHGYPLDWCGYAGCGEATADTYCQREEGKDSALDFEKGTANIGFYSGTYVYTQTDGYNNPDGREYFKTVICDASQYPPDFEPTCSDNSDCGEDEWLTEWGIYWGPRCVNGNIIYQPYKTYTCENPGTFRAACSSSVNAWEVKEECEYGCSAETNTCNTPPEICDGIDNDFDGLIDEDNPCDDGLWCNGQETCHGVGGCSAGTPPDCSDGVGCTLDYCDDFSDTCGNLAADYNCDDNLWCNGAETCDKTLDCQAGTPPCEDTVDCTDNMCNEGTDRCYYIENDDYCDDGLYCNGEETCNWLLGCQAGTSLDRTEGCITYMCNEDFDYVFRDLDDSYCSDGLFCTGYEWCSIYGCRSSSPKDCNDGLSCTTDSCNEGTYSCDNIPINNDGDAYDLCVGDCDDNDNTVWQYITGYVDSDTDSYGIDPSQQVCSGLTLPNGYVTNNLDCDDTDPSINPDGNETLDGKDNDCDGLIDEYLCGNGILDFGEFCDDGNIADGDGCNSTCWAEEIAPDFDTIVFEDNGDGTYNYTFVDDDIPMIFIPNNDGLIDLTNVSFDYASSGNIVSLLISNLTLEGTTKEVTIRFKKDLCMVDKPTVIGGSPTGSPDCFTDPDRIVWEKNVNECNQQGVEVIGRDANGIDVPQYTCEQVSYGQTYAEIKGLNHTLIIGRDPIDEDGDGYIDDDCDDNNPNINPGAVEICNGIDDDCDEVIDNGGNLLCDDSIWCNGEEVCNNGCTSGVPIDCSYNNIPSINTCNNNPDNNPFTSDYFIGFTSVCNEDNDACTLGIVDLSHSCSIEICGAGCETDEDCVITECDNLDNCYSGTYRDYEDVENSCVDCACTENECSVYDEVITDNDLDGFDSECDYDCDDDYSDVNPSMFEIPGNDIDEDCDDIILCNSIEEWKNHGQYVSCVSKESNKLVDADLITKKQKDSIVKEAAKSDVGKKK